MWPGELLVAHTIKRGDRKGRLRPGAYEHESIGQASQGHETPLEWSDPVLHHDLEGRRQGVRVDGRDEDRVRPGLGSGHVPKRSLTQARPQPGLCQQLNDLVGCRPENDRKLVSAGLRPAISSELISMTTERSARRSPR